MSGYPVGVAGWAKRYNEVDAAQQRSWFPPKPLPTGPIVTMASLNSVLKHAFSLQIPYETWETKR